MQPDYARSAHITLRGPYKNKKDINQSIIGKDVGKIVLRRPGTFFSGHQNTVFLGVEISGVSDFWYKPDFPEGVPHLSIYDGSDRRLGWAAMNTLRKYKWGLSLNSTPMQILEKKRQLETEFIVRYQELSSTLNMIAGRVFSAEEIKNLSDLDRVLLLDKICHEIHYLTHPS